MKNIYLNIVCCFLLTLGSPAQSIQDYLLEAEKNSPELNSERYNYLSKVAYENEVGSLPNTTFSGGFFVQEAETRVGAQKAKLSVSQMLPWFGTLAAKKESASYRSEAQLNNIDLAKRMLFLNVKKSYYQLYELTATSNILNKYITILDTFEKLALNALENNRATMVDVLKIKMEKNSVHASLQTTTENLQAKKIAFNLLLNRDEKASINVPDTILTSDYKQLIDKNSLYQNPRLLQLDNLNKALIKSESAAKKEGLPTIGVGLDYIFVENRSVTNLKDNGKDIVMPMISVSVPLFSKKYKSKQKQLQLKQKAIETTKKQVSNDLKTMFETGLSRLKNAETTIKTQLKNMEQARQAQKVLLTAYQSASIDFEQVLEIQQLMLNFQKEKIKAEKEYAIQRSVLEFLISTHS